jgi:hypothetical protein
MPTFVLERAQWGCDQEVQWENVLKRTQWDRYQALEAPGQAASLAWTGTTLLFPVPWNCPGQEKIP